MLAQILGAMCASGIVYANYKSAIDVFEGGPNIRTVPGYSETASAGIFCTYPADFMTKTGQFFSEFIASTILMFLIYALKDDANLGAGNLVPLGLFFVIFGIGACFGWEVGPVCASRRVYVLIDSTTDGLRHKPCSRFRSQTHVVYAWVWHERVACW